MTDQRTVKSAVSQAMFRQLLDLLHGIRELYLPVELQKFPLVVLYAERQARQWGFANAQEAFEKFVPNRAGAGNTKHYLRAEGLYHGHYVVDGKSYTSAREVHRMLQSHGFPGTLGATAHKLRQGVARLEDLLKYSAGHARNTQTAEERNKKRDERRLRELAGWQ